MELIGVNANVLPDYRSGSPADATDEGRTEQTIDHQRIEIRPVTPGDVDALVRLHTDLSEESMYFRFFGSSRSTAAGFATHLVDAIGPSRQALTAWNDGTLVGVASYARIGPSTAELAVLVAEGWHQRGIGTMLVRHLATRALRSGITTFEADVLDANILARRLLDDLGYSMNVCIESGVDRYVLHLDRPRE